jgi:streptogramin lyase
VFLIVVGLPGVSMGRPASGVRAVAKYQRYAGEEGLGVGFGSIWVSSVDNGESVARMNIVTSKSVSISAPSDEDSAIGVGPDAVWMDDFAGGIVRRIDPATNKITASTKGLLGPSGFAFSGRDVWVALHHAQSVAELDGRTGRVRARLAVPAPGGGVTAGGPSSVAVGFGSVWAAVPNIAAVVRLDPVRRKVVAVIHGLDGGDVAVVGGSVWAISGGSADRIDPKTNAVNARIHLAASADNLVAPVAVLDGRLWAAPNNSIVEIDPRSARVISRTVFGKAFFKDLETGHGALWAWDANTNQINELRPY